MYTVVDLCMCIVLHRKEPRPLREGGRGREGGREGGRLCIPWLIPVCACVLSLYRKEFPNSLSTKVSVGTQAVYMMAGLAKKRGHAGGANMRDAVLALDSAGGVVIPQTIKLSKEQLSMPLAATTSQTSLTGSRPDYSTQSPLAISSKAVHGMESLPEVGVALNGGEGVGLDGVPKAKRIKLMEDELSQHGVNNDVTEQALSAKLEKLLAKNPSLIRPSPLERTPSPALRTPSPSPASLMTPTSTVLRTPSPTPSLDSDSLYTSPLHSRTVSPLPPEPRNASDPSGVPPGSLSDTSSNPLASSSNMKCCWSMCTG